MMFDTFAAAGDGAGVHAVVEKVAQFRVLTQFMKTSSGYTYLTGVVKRAWEVGGRINNNG